MAQSPKHEAGLAFTPMDDLVTLVQSTPVSPPLHWPSSHANNNPLNVIALISGGKDSFYTILHCLSLGHRIVALANLHPQILSTPEQEQEDLNSHMYQTVGHKIIPYYAAALRIPLYRRPITGTQLQKETTYSPPAASLAGSNEEETESLLPLLKAVMRDHPNANAVCSGAILSDYQRTRVESVAGRLGLVPLAYLWKYPVLPPGDDPNSLLRDMAAAGLDARIIRIASADLDDRVLTTCLADARNIGLMDRIVARYSSESSGAGLGEGGEYETLVVDGPDHIFKSRIEVEWPQEKDYVREGWGNVWVDVQSVKALSKEPIENSSEAKIRNPDLLDRRFREALKVVHAIEDVGSSICNYNTEIFFPATKDFWEFRNSIGNKCSVVAKDSHTNIQAEMKDILDQMAAQLKELSIEKSEVMFTVILLRSLDNFRPVNEVYGEFFPEPNPPARATFAVGETFPSGTNIILQYTYVSAEELKLGPRKGLHVQSRSYWAPANIARYSQATSIPLSAGTPEVRAVSVAGQIPLNPATMEHPSAASILEIYQSDSTRQGDIWREKFDLHALLSLQHLWRIGEELDVCWWTGVVAYLSHDEQKPWLKARIAGRAWELLHKGGSDLESKDGDEERDAYDEMQRGRMNYGTSGAPPSVKTLPDWSVVEVEGGMDHYIPPFFAAEVEELPLKSDIEWHALLGLTGGPIKTYTKSEESVGTIHEWELSPNSVHITLLIPWKSSANTHIPEDVNSALHKLSSVPKFNIISKNLAEPEGFLGAHTAYIDFKDEGFSSADSFGGVVPCRSLHDIKGRRLAAVLMWKCDFEKADVA